MARFSAIDDPTDERLRPYRDLRDPALRRAVEAPGPGGQGLFIAEGKRALGRLLTSPYPIVSVLVAEPRAAELRALLEPSDVEVLVAGRSVVDAVAGFAVHRGVLAAAARRALPDPFALVRGLRHVVVAEALNDQENLGAIVRSAVALGFQALLLDPTCCDPLYRRVVRVSMGNVLHLPFARLSPWPAALDDLRRAGFTTVALSPSPDAEALDTAELASIDRAAILLGAESTGLTPASLASVDRVVRIAQRADVDSLNVGHAAAIAFHARGAT